ncbi:MAG: GNAT family N-acetyltransferase [Turicibacter sp.]|nr:GNAT family N-acetyltransferase [Turicibacter sp.]
MKYNEKIVSNALTIRELATDELARAFPVISQLRPHLTLEEYVAMVKQMKERGYQVICLFKNEQVLAYAGVVRRLNLYDGDHLWVDDLVTDENNRGEGYGELLLAAVETFAKENGLGCVALSSGFQRQSAHKFYEKTMKYAKLSYLFKKDV